jgi:type IX secretion system PorP/SprF family membrane protein
MSFKCTLSIKIRIIIPVILTWSIVPTFAQQIPQYPVSYRIFSPFIFNPAMAGSKDFSSIDLITGWNGKFNSQIISANSRLAKKGESYFMTPNTKKYSGFGIGGYLFNEKKSPSRNLGIAAAGSYQLPLDEQSVSFLSFGVAVKGVYNIMDSVFYSDPLMNTPEKRIFYPNFDAGIYYYSPKLFAGASAVNLLGNPEDPDSTGVYRLSVARHYYFIAGYKFTLSESLDIVLEPSLIINKNRYNNEKASDFLEPMLKLYVQGFCLGTYLYDYDNISFFFQFKYPKFYVGTFFELPRKTPFYKKDINLELTFGLNFTVIRSRNIKYYHW